MKERPILFSGPMVRAILEGRKTQTRRVVKPQPKRAESGFLIWRDMEVLEEGTYLSPHGVPGDRLWVRETFTEGEGVIYRADWEVSCPLVSLDGHWKPSIFMPRRLCRIVLEIVSVRIERLNAITHMDAIAEGCTPHPGAPAQSMGDDYKRLWESINGLGSWELNPWVWVIEFRKVEAL